MKKVFVVKNVEQYIDCIVAYDLDEVKSYLIANTYTLEEVNAFEIVYALDDYKASDKPSIHHYMMEVLGDRYVETHFLVLYLKDEKFKDDEAISRDKKNDWYYQIQDLQKLQRDIYNKLDEETPEDVRGHISAAILIIDDALAQLHTAHNKNFRLRLGDNVGISKTEGF